MLCGSYFQHLFLLAPHETVRQLPRKSPNFLTIDKSPVGIKGFSPNRALGYFYRSRARRAGPTTDADSRGNRTGCRLPLVVLSPRPYSHRTRSPSTKRGRRGSDFLARDRARVFFGRSRPKLLHMDGRIFCSKDPISRQTFGSSTSLTSSNTGSSAGPSMC